MRSTGDTLVAWSGPGGAQNEVFARLFDKNGFAQGAEFVVNANIADSQERPAMALAGADAVVVAFEVVSTKAVVRLQAFSSAGALLAVDIAATDNPVLYTDQRNPALSAVSATDVLLCWDVQTKDATAVWDVVCRRFTAANLAPLASEFAVTTFTKGMQKHASIARIGAGYAVAWDTEYVDTTGTAVEVQRFGAGGSAVGPRFVANRVWTQNQQAPFLAPAGSELFVGWESEEQDGDLVGLYYRVVPMQ